DAYDGLADVGKLALLDALLPVYEQVLARFKAQGVEWVQIDEPVLVLDLPQEWQDAFRRVYQDLNQSGLKLLLATYFDDLHENVTVLKDLPIAGVHVDAVRAPAALQAVQAVLGQDQVLSAGVISGRDIWRTDLEKTLQTLEPLKAALGERLWIAPSCSLLHVPMDVQSETGLDAELKSWLSFAVQKLDELKLLQGLLDGTLDEAGQQAVQAQQAALRARRESRRTHNPAVQAQMAKIDQLKRQRTPFFQRIQAQRNKLNLPAFPTTTIGSFPQTTEIRTAR